MTDGIIQEVIKNALLGNFGIQEKTYLDCTCGYCSLARDIQQELIQKIKQEFPRIGEAFYAGTVLIKLIGDNQE